MYIHLDFLYDVAWHQRPTIHKIATSSCPRAFFFLACPPFHPRFHRSTGVNFFFFVIYYCFTVLSWRVIVQSQNRRCWQSRPDCAHLISFCPSFCLGFLLRECIRLAWRYVTSLDNQLHFFNLLLSETTSQILISTVVPFSASAQSIIYKLFCNSISYEQSSFLNIFFFFHFLRIYKGQ